MEPFAAASLAGNILQFIQFTTQLVSTSREIIESGTKDEYLELELIAKDLRTRADRIVRLKTSGNFQPLKQNEEDQPLEVLAIKCKDIADELINVLENLKLEPGSNRWKSFTTALRTQWQDHKIEALRDRLQSLRQAINAHLSEGYQSLIISRMDELVERSRQLESRTQAIEAPKADFVNIFNEQNVEKPSRIAAESLSYSAEQIVLSELRFPHLDYRYVNISSAHRKTLSWLFGASDERGKQVDSPNFVEWLQSEDDLYWISGRPGSGKSTLMKFLCTHDQTKENLKSWAKNDDVIIAEYFFWTTGKNNLQKSQQGLLRSLLYQILRQTPDYIRLVFPGAWRSHNVFNNVASGNSSIDSDTSVPTDVPGLVAALKRTCTFLTQSSKRLCFFIDGLDEYEGKKVDVIELIGGLKALNHVKICISSRQWNEFEDAYGKNGTAKLYMQDFNTEDITSYVEDVFQNDDNYQELEDKESHGETLVNEIVSKANGVFLWVTLVVRSFQEGLQEGDSIRRLQNRLHELPSELEQLFDRILFHDVKPSYRSQGAQILLVALKAKDTLPLMAYWFLDAPELPAEREPLRSQETIRRHKQTKKRLIASCRGLLEPHYQSTNPQEGSLPNGVLFEYKVDFLHRTVRDYLELPTTDIQRWAPAGFDPHEAICKILYSHVKLAPHGHEYGPHIATLCAIFDYHAQVLRQTEKYNANIRGLETELLDMTLQYGVKTKLPSAIPQLRAPEQPTSTRKRLVSRLSRTGSRSTGGTK